MPKKIKVISLLVIMLAVLFIFVFHKTITEIYGLGKIIISTPFVSPYHDEVIRAAYRTLKGDRSENPPLEMLHGNLSAKLATNRFNKSEWEINTTPKGILAIHKKFLDIENMASSGNRGIQYSKDLLVRYLDTYSRYRVSYSEIYRKVLLGKGKDNETKKINEMSSYMFSRNILDSGKLVLLAIPFEDLPKTISPWVVMHESGIVFASADKNHDFLSQINEYKKSYPYLSNNEIVDRIAAHEGSHGDVEAMIAYTLKLNQVNPIYEGIPGALSNHNSCDGRDMGSVLEELSNMTNILRSNSRTDISYDKGACFWLSVYDHVKTSAMEEPETWARIFKVSLQTSFELTAGSKDFFALSEDQRLSLFFKLLIQNLGISTQETKNISPNK